MKKRFLLTTLILLLIPVAYAQEITLFNQTFSIVLILPLILIVIGLLFFGAILIKDNWKKISALFSPKRKKEVKEKKYKVDYFYELGKFESKVDKMDIKESFKQFNGLLKDYLKDTYKIEHELTYEELKKTLGNKNKTLIEISKRISDIKYTGKRIQKSEIFELIQKLKKDSEKHRPVKELTKGEEISSKLEALKRRLHISNFIKPLELPKLETSKVSMPILRKEKKLKAPSKKIEIEIKKKSRFSFKNIFNKFRPNKEKAEDKKIRKEIDLSRKKILSFVKEGITIADKDLEKAEELYGMALDHYYKIPGEEKSLANKLIDLHEKIAHITLEEEKQQLNKLIQKVELKKRQIPQGQHFFLDTIKVALNKVDNLEKKPYLGLEDSYKDLGLLRKLSKRDKEEMKSKDFMEKLKILSEKIEAKKDLGNTKLREKEVDFLKSTKALVDHVKGRQKKGIFKLKETEQDFFEKAELLLEYLKDREKLVESKESKLNEFEDNLIDSIKELKKPKDIPAPRKPSPLLESLKETDHELNKIHKEVTIHHYHGMMRPLFKIISKLRHKPIEFNEETPKIEVVGEPKLKTKRYLELDKQHNQTLKELSTIEKEHAKQLKEDILSSMKPSKKGRKRKRKSAWEIHKEKVRIGTSGKIEALNREEEKIYKKLTSL